MDGALRQENKRLRETMTVKIRRVSYARLRFALIAETRKTPQDSREGQRDLFFSFSTFPLPPPRLCGEERLAPNFCRFSRFCFPWLSLSGGFSFKCVPTSGALRGVGPIFEFIAKYKSRLLGAGSEDEGQNALHSDRRAV